MQYLLHSSQLKSMTLLTGIKRGVTSSAPSARCWKQNFPTQTLAGSCKRAEVSAGGATSWKSTSINRLFSALCNGAMASSRLAKSALNQRSFRREGGVSSSTGATAWRKYYIVAKPALTLCGARRLIRRQAGHNRGKLACPISAVAEIRLGEKCAASATSTAKEAWRRRISFGEALAASRAVERRD